MLYKWTFRKITEGTWSTYHGALAYTRVCWSESLKLWPLLYGKQLATYLDDIISANKESKIAYIMGNNYHTILFRLKSLYSTLEEFLKLHEDKCFDMACEMQPGTYRFLSVEHKLNFTNERSCLWLAEENESSSKLLPVCVRWVLAGKYI